MRWSGLPVPRSSIRALWLGWTALGLVFVGFFLGGGGDASEALWLSFALAVAAGVGWLSAPSPIALRRLGPAALAFGAVIGVSLLTVMPLPDTVARTGLYEVVGGRSLSIAPAATVIEVAKLFGLGCVFLCGVFAARGERTPARLVNACIVLTALWAAWSMILFVSAGSQGRLGAPFLSPNTAATLLGAGVILTLGRLLAWRDARGPSADRRWELTWLGGALLLLSVALVLTQSRAGLGVAVLCALGLAACWPAPSGGVRPRKRWFLAGAAAIALLVVAEAARGLLLRLPGLGEAAADRKDIFAVYWTAFLDAPLFGGGLGTATYVTKLGLTPANYGSLWNVQSAHNWALQWIAEGGLAAALPMAAAIGLLIYEAFRGLDTRSARVLLPLLFVNVMVLTHGLTDFALQIPAFAMYWSFLLGLQVAIGGARTERLARPDASGCGETGQ